MWRNASTFSVFTSSFVDVITAALDKYLTKFIFYLLLGIVHRDLKLENILIAGCHKTENEDPLYDIKVSCGKSCVRLVSCMRIRFIVFCYKKNRTLNQLKNICLLCNLRI